MADSGPAQAKGESRRAHYRIDYPEGDRPHLRYGKRRYEILNLSEGGIKIEIPQSDELPLEETLSVTIELVGGKEIEVEGHVLRRDTDTTVLHLSSRVPLSVIVEEQRQQIAKYRRLNPA